LGIHILSPSEAPAASNLLNVSPDSQEWHYVTIPLTLNDVEKKQEWQNFFNYAKQEKLIPIVRLSTKAEGGNWKKPTKKEVVDLISFLSTLEWPTDDKFIIVFNEVNHTHEWGGNLEPERYAEILRFASNWAKSENLNYHILPAAMDLAAPNSATTMEAFTYLNRMLAADSSVLSYIDYWNSHSYPNPGFSASPQRNDQASMRGYQHELSYVKTKSGRDLKTFITETGWIDNRQTNRWLTNYYSYASENIWNDPRIVAVTPFVLQGAPGPFAGFTFIDSQGNPTHQYRAYQDVIKKLAEKK
jgi:hypothetical protein